MPRNPYRREPYRCSCATPGMTDEQFHKPHNKVGRHLDPKCPHSELYNSVVAFPAHWRLEHAKRNNATPMRRTVGS